jgi:uncharacterized protein (DUF2141 family)
MNKHITVFILSIGSLLAQAAAADPMSGDLTIAVGGFSSDRGQMIANLFREGDDVMQIDKAYLHAREAVSGNRAQLIFRNLKYGKYAVTVFHDENGNGALDHNFLNFPAEPLGFSNYFDLGMLSGLPSFEKLQFDFAPGAETISILVK